MSVSQVVYTSIKKIIQEDQKVFNNLIYYAIVEAVLVLSIPLASSFMINSIMSHAEISVYVLGGIVMVLFAIVTALQILQEYIVEKFQQKVFLTTAIDVSLKATSPELNISNKENEHRRYMNYFFDITSIQKFFPILLLDGVGIVIKVVTSLILLALFDPALFTTGLIFFAGYLALLLLLGKNGISTALERSDAKHSAIYCLQNIHHNRQTREKALDDLDQKLSHYAKARQSLFNITIRQMGLTFVAEGIIFSGFMMIGGYLVVEGKLPVGEFIAAEIVVVSIVYALKGFVKQLDYIYDTIEGFYKVDKLSKHIGDQK